jgi:hypothetical protein
LYPWPPWATIPFVRCQGWSSLTARKAHNLSPKFGDTSCWWIK